MSSLDSTFDTVQKNGRLSWHSITTQAKIDYLKKIRNSLKKRIDQLNGDINMVVSLIMLDGFQRFNFAILALGDQQLTKPQFEEINLLADEVNQIFDKNFVLTRTTILIREPGREYFQKIQGPFILKLRRFKGERNRNKKLSMKKVRSTEKFKKRGKNIIYRIEKEKEKVSDIYRKKKVDSINKMTKIEKVHSCQKKFKNSTQFSKVKKSGELSIRKNMKILTSPDCKKIQKYKESTGRNRN